MLCPNCGRDSIRCSNCNYTYAYSEDYIQSGVASIVDIIYYAAFCDAEGSISIDKTIQRNKRRNPAYRAQVIIANTKVSILMEIQSHYRGNITAKQPRNSNQHTCYQLVLAARTAVPFLRDVLPFLKLKREQALIALELQERCARTLKHHLIFSKEEIALRERLWLRVLILNGRKKMVNTT